jgi:hypothetical protein
MAAPRNVVLFALVAALCLASAPAAEGKLNFFLVYRFAFVFDGDRRARPLAPLPAPRARARAQYWACTLIRRRSGARSTLLYARRGAGAGAAAWVRKVGGRRGAPTCAAALPPCR